MAKTLNDSGCVLSSGERQVRLILRGLLPATLRAGHMRNCDKEVHDAPAVRGSIIANMLQEHDAYFTFTAMARTLDLHRKRGVVNKRA